MSGRETVWRALESSEEREVLVRSTCREGEGEVVVMLINRPGVAGAVLETAS